MESIAVSVSAVTAVHELTSSRDERLNDKAYMWAIMQKPSHNRCPDSPVSTTFQLSQDVSIGKMAEERLARERVLQMQTDISRYLAQL